MMPWGSAAIHKHPAEPHGSALRETRGRKSVEAAVRLVMVISSPPLHVCRQARQYRA